MRGWAGNFHNDKEIPNQYRTYLSGGIDPTFSRYVYDRAGLSSFALMQDQYIQSGRALRGLLKEDNSFVSSSSMTWGLNLDAKIPFLPNIFYDFAGGNDFKNTYSSAGIVLGPVIVPLYQSWEEIDQTANDAKWILDRIRLQFNFNLSSFVKIILNFMLLLLNQFINSISISWGLSLMSINTKVKEILTLWIK